MKSRPILHPFFFILFFNLSLLASNLSVVRSEAVLRPLLVSLLAGLFVFLFLQYKIRDWAAAGLLCSILLVVFFGYGHLHRVMLLISAILLINFIPDLAESSLAILLHPFLIAIWIGLFLWLRKTILRIYDRRWFITNLLNFVTSLLLIWPSFQILRHEWNLREVTSVSPQASGSSDVIDLSPTLSSMPDIYYIILDGYARNDTLSSVYDYDNSQFLGFLQDLGFQTAEDSMSNYAQTVLSIASSLNMDYLDALSGGLDPDSRDVNWLRPLIRQSRVREFLGEKGYQFLAFESGYAPTDVPDADIYLQSPTQATSTFESLWIRTTALLLLEDASSLVGLPYPYSGYRAHMTQIEYIFNELQNVGGLPGPKFVFAHILIPHPPFVFDSNGEPLPQRHKFMWGDASDFPGSSDEYKDGYRQQISFTNLELEQILPNLLANSSTPPIVILQGDHGPAAHLDWTLPLADHVEERMAILNAIFIPGNHVEILNDNQTPVNSFRIIFNHVFGTNYVILEDRSYFSVTSRPFDLGEVSED